MTTEVSSSDPTYRALLSSSEAEPAERLHRLALADWLDENTDLHAQAQALRATCDALVEYAELERAPDRTDVHEWSVRRYHTEARDSYSWVGIYPTLKDGVVACYHWHLRGERDVQCEECRSVVLARRLGAAAEPSPLGCGLCDGSGWTPRCQADGCNEPGEPCGEILEGEEGREDTEYFCPKHAVDAGFCRACRCPIGLETAGQLCGECAWEARSDAMDEEDSWHGHEAGEDHDEDYP